LFPRQLSIPNPSIISEAAVLTFILLLAGFVLFVLAALDVIVPRINLIAAGLACWILVALIAAWPGN
jgi:hypothetical protein